MKYDGHECYQGSAVLISSLSLFNAVCPKDLAEQLKDPEFRKEYEALQPEHAVIQAMIDARKASGQIGRAHV